MLQQSNLGESIMADDSREHRKFVYGFAREALKRKATPEEVVYALELIEPLNGHKALGLKLRLRRKAAGESYNWSSM